MPARVAMERFGKSALAREYGYTALLVSLLLLMVVAPLARQLGLGDLVGTVLVSLVLVAGLYAVSDRQRIVGIAALLALAALMVNWIVFAGRWDRLETYAMEVTGILFFGLVVVILLRDILGRQGRVSWSLIHGALSVYLLIGVVFAFVFSLVATASPGSFANAAAVGGTDLHTYVYFSFVTLTTVGYGDMTPIAPVAASLATLEAVVGQVYLTVLIARLVGMHISSELARDRQ